ncbi:flavin monoamine oxidase family protein [Mesorhizobium sp. Cs1299R1N3]|uniref:flavin monoamine oxidase family protein n=1 Tax=Mesorhizobium sp. Cs1299R1N3 TaxID=3015173 RepID=UPI00301D0255
MQAERATSEKVYRQADVVVVGLGISGLIAMNLLEKQGISTIGVDGRDRIGGRVASIRTRGGRAFEAGGEFVKPGHKRVLATLEALDIATVPVPEPFGLDVVIHGGTRWEERSPFAEMPASQAAYNDLHGRFRALFTDWGAGGASEAPDEHLSFGGWAAHHATDAHAINRFCRDIVFGMGGRDAAGVSFAAALDYHSSVPHENCEVRSLRIAGGGSQIALRLSNQIAPGKFLLQSEVTSISSTHDAVRVRHRNGEIEASMAIVAMSPALARSIRIDPPLPAQKIQTQDAWIQRSAIKSLIIFDRPWWRDRNLSGHADGDLALMQVLDVSPMGTQEGWLMAFENVDTGLDERHTAGQYEAHAAANLRRYFGEFDNPISDFGAQVWALDPFAGGCGSPLPPGFPISARLGLAEPHGSILFAGTEIARSGWGSIEGAICAGERAAAEALSRLRVTEAG